MSNKKMSRESKKSVTAQQIELLQLLKQQLDMVYRQLNHFRGAMKNVDKLNRGVKGLIATTPDNSNEPLITEFVKFDRNYRYWRKRLRKLDRKLLAVNLYDKLYDLYESINQPAKPNSDNKSGVKDLTQTKATSNVDSGAEEEIFITENDIEVNLNTPELENSLKVSSAGGKRLTRRSKAKSLIKEKKIEAKIKLSSSKKSSNKAATSKSKSVPKKRKTTKQELSSKSSKPPKTKKPKTQQPEAPKLLFCETGGCQYSTIRSWDMKKHKATHSNHRPFKCDKCDLAFKVKGQLKEHQNIHEGRRFRCSFEGCSVNFSTQSRLRSHVKIFHTKEAPLLLCNWEGCEYSTNRTDYLKSHRTVHTGERPFKCIWPDCDQAFRSPSHLWRHKLTHQNDNQHRFKCSYEGCDYSTYRNDHLQNHRVVHSGERPFKCPDCDQAFKLASNLSHHRKIHKNQQQQQQSRQYNCSFEGCDFVDSLVGNLNKHEEIKHGKKFTELKSNDSSIEPIGEMVMVNYGTGTAVHGGGPTDIVGCMDNNNHHHSFKQI